MTIRFLPLIAAAALATAAPAAAGTISLSWDPVAGEELAGYRIYHGTTPGELPLSIDIGVEPSATLEGLADCTAHYIAVKALDSSGQESVEFSNVVSGWPRPTIATAQPSSVEQGQQTAITLDGTNFQSGASVGFSDPAITVDGVQVVGCTQLIVTVSVSAGAAPGLVAVEVVNPDQVFGSRTDLIVVGQDATAPVISNVAAGPVGATSALVTWSTDEPASARVYYRPAGETVYQASEPFAGPATEHGVTLQGLTPDTTYEFHVESADPSGNSDTSTPDQSFATSSSSFSYIRFEAESGSAAQPLTVAAGTDVFRAASLELPTGSPAGTPAAPSGVVQLGFHVPQDGDWRVWLRVSAESGEGWLEGMDGAALAPAVATTANEWGWVPARAWTLDQGLHTLTLGGRDAGSRVDRVLVTDDPSFVPTESPGADVVPPAPLFDATAVPGVASIDLAWTVSSDDDSDRVVVRFSVDGQWPQAPADGWPLVDDPVVPNAAGGLVHDGLTNGASYRYALFVIDRWGNASDPVLLEASPQSEPPPSVQNLERTDTK